jgi:hypothetical protein
VLAAATPASDVWSYILSNGKSAEQTLVELHTMMAAASAADIAAAVWNKTLP